MRSTSHLVTGSAAVVCSVALVLCAVAAPGAAAAPTRAAAVITRCAPGTWAASASLTSDPDLTSVARMVLSSAENSSLNWEDQYGYIEYDVEGNAAENRGYTAGIVGFTSKTHDMLELVRLYTKAEPGNPLAPFLPALEKVDGSSSAIGLGDPFVTAWKQAAATPTFQKAQRDAADSMYLRPAVAAAQNDGLGRLGQFIYYDAMVMHGPGTDALSFDGMRAAARRAAVPPAKGGNETTYLNTFLDVRTRAMQAEEAHNDVTRISMAQRVWLRSGNLGLKLPLTWSVYGDPFAIQPAGRC